MKKIRFIYLCILLCVILFDCKANEEGNDLTDSLKLLGSLMIVDELPPPNLTIGSPAAASFAHSSSQLILAMLTPLSNMGDGLYGTAIVRISDSVISVSEPMTITCQKGGLITVDANYLRAYDNNFQNQDATFRNLTDRRYFNWGRLQGSFDITNIANNCKYEIFNDDLYVNYKSHPLGFSETTFQGNANIRNINHYYEQFRYVEFIRSFSWDYRTFIKRTTSFTFNSSNLIVNGSGPRNVSLEVFTKVKNSYLKAEVPYPCCTVFFYNPQGRIDVVVKGTVDGESVFVSYSVDALPFYTMLGKISSYSGGY
ncbi:hypothetical protein [Leptospira yasudae]|uniref:hypothetical protein n=1 Tax=Leptospira yasudae TaxID=2202201 RepID=UPI001091436B|nr:hypothetical protein [Leptospira yasudae]TGM97923.1 hypothetical protein EHR10_13610 [Leptospira yasudae]